MNEIRTFDAALFRPHPILTLSPKLHIAFESHARKYAAFARSADMMAAERMRLFENLHFGKRALFSSVFWVEVASRGRRVDPDRRRARRGDELCGSGRERKYVRWMGLGDRVHLKVLFRHGGGIVNLTFDFRRLVPPGMEMFLMFRRLDSIVW
jgi:hypothetical protein